MSQEIDVQRYRTHAQNIIDGLEPHDGASIAQWLEDEIERRGLTKEYIAALWGEVGCAGHNGEGPNIWREEWLFIRATPEQKARAFLAAVL